MRCSLGWAVVTVLALVVWGCGGGGSSAVSTSGNGGGDQVFSQGPLTFSAKAGAKPVINAGGLLNTNLIAVSNGSFTNVLATLPHSLQSTYIAYGQVGQVWSYGYGSGTSTLLTALSGFSDSSFPAANAIGRVLFCHNDPATGHRIYLMNADGTSSHPISPSPANVTEPCWGPDNSTVYFAQVVNGLFTITKMTSSGTGVTPLHSATESETEPSVSATGLIAYSRFNRTSNLYELWTMTTSGTNAHAIEALGTADAVDPCFSPDGTEILFTISTPSGSYIAMTDPIENHLDQVTPSTSGIADGSPSWAPDGKHIVFTRSDGTLTYRLMIADFDGQNVQPLLSGPDPYNHPSWSPYIANRLFVGTGGSVGAASNGFILGQANGQIASFFNVVTSSGAVATIAPDPNNALVEKVTLPSGTITNLLYMNSLWGGPVTVPVSNTHQALVTYDANGLVTLVVPVAKMKPPVASKTGTVYSGEILGIYDGKGHNLAPGGATQITIGRDGKLMEKR